MSYKIECDSCGVLLPLKQGIPIQIGRRDGPYREETDPMEEFQFCQECALLLATQLRGNMLSRQRGERRA